MSDQPSSPREQPLNCDRDASRWAREFNDVLEKRYKLRVDEGWLLGWFATAFMCGEDTYRWRKEALQSERVAIELVTLKEEDILWRSNIIEECARLVDMCNSEGPFNAIAAASRIRALKEQTPSEIAQTNAAAQAPKPTDHGRANPVEIASKPEPQPASAAFSDDKRETPRTEAFWTEKLGGPAISARHRTNSEWLSFARQLERELNDMDYCHSQMVAERDRWYRRATKAEAELNAARSATGERIYTKADMEAACQLVAGANKKADQIRLDKLIDRFLAWPLPDSVCSDTCVSQRGYPHRIGTNLLTADEARQMLSYVLNCPIS